MWSRWGLFAVCYFVAVNSLTQNDGVLDKIKNAGARFPLANESSYNENEKPIFAKENIAFRNQEESNRNERRTSPNFQEESFKKESSTSKYTQNNQGSFSGRPLGGSNQYVLNGETENLTGRPSELNRENSPHSNGLGENNQEQSFGQPSGGSTHSKDHREQEHTPSQFRPSPTGESSSSRPAGDSAYNNRKSDHHQPGSRPSNSGASFSVRPSEGSNHFTNHREGDHHSSQFGLINEKDQFTRPIGEPSHNQQTGFKPGNQNHPSGQGINKPDLQEGPGHSFTDSELGQNQFPAKPNQQTGLLNNNETEVDEAEKEDEEDVCFTHLGCFTMKKPWKSVLRPIRAPQSPEKIQTTINFYSRANLEKPLNITLHPQINMGEVHFEPRKITAMIVHGFSNSGNATWMKDMKNVYLKKVDANVMIVDWGKGAQLLSYLQVAGNTRIVGKQLGVFIKFLIEKFGADPGKFHLIGHSLGAQICSYLGKEVPGIARLTALDPAQPGFEGFDREVRLDRSDAEFVDVIHTDARPFIPTLGFGMIAPHGHVDFYMNGGFDQPGCIPPPKKELPAIKSFLDFAKYPVEVISKAVACPHGRAYEYLIESFNETDNCIFWGHKADAKNVFKSVTNTVTQGLLKKFTALSSTCSKENCIPVGFVTKNSPLRGIFVVTTNARSPYCISEPGVPPEIPPQERKQDSFIQKIGRKTGITG